MVGKSFKQFQFIRQKAQNRKLYQSTRSFVSSKESLFSQNQEKYEAFEKIYNLQKQKEELEKQMLKFYSNPQITLNFLTIGRLVFVEGLGWCPVVNFSRFGRDVALEVFSIVDNHNDPFINKHLKSNSATDLKLLGLEYSDDPKIISVDYKRLRQITSIILVISKDLMPLQTRKILKETILQVMRDFPSGLPLLKLKEDIPIENDKLAGECETNVEEIHQIDNKLEVLTKDVMRLYRDYVLDHRTEVDFDTKLDYFLMFDEAKLQALQKLFIKNEFFNLEIPEFEELVKNICFSPSEMAKRITSNGLEVDELFDQERKSHSVFFELKKNIGDLKDKISKEEKIVEHEKLESMKRVVRRKDFLNDQEVVIQKGRVASHIFGVDELLITEILLQGILVDITDQQLPILFSVFVNESKPNEKTQKPQIDDEAIIKAFDQIKSLSKEIATASKESGLEVNVEQAELALNPSLMKTVSMWVEGKSFNEVCMQSDEYEGNIIRSIKRLYEMLKQLSNCADVLGNKSMKKKFSDGAELLNRGIVFAASLYI